ncbi:hypothetical protein [Taibaiella koreensis]|uniref:hypothetical protein n=1 Tax=Taibaiella koreensis TaxID=1268548 RepID=UPI000E59ACC2|nr:hypothetical protein [Taibaiella koreensis]
MSKNEFDELLLKKLRDEELEYNPAHWDRLAQLLSPTLTPPSAGKRKKQWLIATGIAAAISLVLGTVFTIQLPDSPDEKPAMPSVAQQQPRPATETTAPETNTAAPAIKPGLPATPAADKPARTNDRNLAQDEHEVLPDPNFHSPIPTVPVPDNDPKVREQIAVAKEPETPSPLKEKTTGNPFRNPAVNTSKAKEEPTYTYHADPAIAMNGFSKRERKTSISLGGGVNYGNLNTGYTAGVSVRHKIAGKLFVDGTVAMMYNNNANNVVANNGPSMGDNGKMAARPTAFNNETSLASPALNPIQKLYYVQLNPSIGYQVEKHVALSFGGDFQRMLNQSDEIVQPENMGSKVFPNMDVGLTAKSEFSITPNIQAGLMFREGINNLLRNDNAKYVNRRYVQVQFKYNIPVN